jgi:tyrosine-protein phosphatase OCA6
MVIYPPYRFAQIEPDLYRGGYPKDRNDSFLSRLELKTIVSLTPNPLTISKINCIHIRVEKPKEGIPLTYQKVNQILSLLLDASNYPIYIHCLDGQLVTSLVLMCLRKWIGWEMHAYHQEAVRYLKEESVTPDQQEFVEKYPCEIEISVAPIWCKKKFKKEVEKVPSPAANIEKFQERGSVVEEVRVSRTILALDLDIRT